MQLEIKNRWSDDVQFVAEIDCDKDAALSLKVGLAVKWAFKSGANLCDANLRDANLRGADLCVYQSGRYTAWVQKTHTRIGCQYHRNEEWRGFDDEKISSMAGDAVEWWTKNKGIIFAMMDSLK